MDESHLSPKYRVLRVLVQLLAVLALDDVRPVILYPHLILWRHPAFTVHLGTNPKTLHLLH